MRKHLHYLHYLHSNSDSDYTEPPMKVFVGGVSSYALILTEAYIKPKALDLATVEAVEVVDAVFSTKVNIHEVQNSEQHYSRVKMEPAGEMHKAKIHEEIYA